MWQTVGGSRELQGILGKSDFFLFRERRRLKSRKKGDGCTNCKFEIITECINARLDGAKCCRHNHQYPFFFFLPLRLSRA